MLPTMAFNVRNFRRDLERRERSLREELRENERFETRLQAVGLERSYGAPTSYKWGEMTLISIGLMMTSVKLKKK